MLTNPRKGPADRILKPQPRILRVLSVQDTRDYEEGPDGKFHPVPGSGIPRACDRCGRDHRVHAEVLLEDETTAIVGTGCMNQAEMGVAKQVKSAERVARRIKQTEASIAALRTELADYSVALAEVSRLKLPPMIEGLNSNELERNAIIAHAELGLFAVFGWERQRARPQRTRGDSHPQLAQQRMTERGWKRDSYHLNRDIKELEESLERALQTLAKSLG